MSKTYNVAVVGLGYVGLVIATVLASRGCRVFGVDTNKKIVDAANKGKPHFFEPGLEDMLRAAVTEGKFTASTDLVDAKEASIKLVTVGTPLGDKLEPDLRAISAVARAMAEAVKPGDILLLKSTVTPGVTEGTFGAILEEASGLKAGQDFFLAFSPERLAEGRAVEEFATLPIVVGSSSPDAEHAIAEFWHDTLGVEVIEMGSPIAAELVKLANNLWIDVNISLANLVAIVAQTYGIASDEIIKAANSLPKGEGHVNILSSSIGVGGSCLTKDPLFFASLVEQAGGDNRLILGARSVNEGMPKMVASWVEQWVNDTPAANRETLKVALVGLAFKDETSDLRYSPMIDFYRQISSAYPNITVYDPFIEDADTRNAFPGAKIADSMAAALEGASVAVFGCNHSEFRSADVVGLINENVQQPGLIIDGRKAIRHRLNGSEGQLLSNLEFRSV
jgi:UDP-N-acetyl-D-mannosaminuronic acid dehydrogenase